MTGNGNHRLDYFEKKFMDALDGFNLFLFVVLIILASLQVSFRYLFFAPLPWTEELSRFFLVWVAFLGAASVTRRKMHILVDYLVSKMPLGQPDHRENHLPPGHLLHGIRPVGLYNNDGGFLAGPSGVDSLAQRFFPLSRGGHRQRDHALLPDSPPEARSFFLPAEVEAFARKAPARRER